MEQGVGLEAVLAWHDLWAQAGFHGLLFLRAPTTFSCALQFLWCAGVISRSCSPKRQEHHRFTRRESACDFGKSPSSVFLRSSCVVVPSLRFKIQLLFDAAG